MRIKKARNTDKAITQIERIDGKTRNAIRKAFYFLGKDLTDTARQLIIKGPKTGKLYRIKGRKKRHRASAPGEPPANLSGALQKTVDFVVQGSSQMVFGAGDEFVDYAKYLELDPLQRVFLKRSIDENERNGEQHFESGIKAELIR